MSPWGSARSKKASHQAPCRTSRGSHSCEMLQKYYPGGAVHQKRLGQWSISITHAGRGIGQLGFRMLWNLTMSLLWISTWWWTFERSIPLFCRPWIYSWRETDEVKVLQQLGMHTGEGDETKRVSLRNSSRPATLWIEAPGEGYIVHPFSICSLLVRRKRKGRKI